MNQSGNASPMTILTLLEETAADHCHAIDHSLYDLVAQNVGWVLLSGKMEMDRYPNYKEKITMRTWLSSYSAVRGIRENVIYDAQDKVIGRAKGLWVFFDIERRRPVQIYGDIKEKWSYNPEESIQSNLTRKIAPIEQANHTKGFRVNRYDTDMNKHVNNIRYLQWLMESMPEEIVNDYYLHSIDGRFISEAQYGNTVKSLTHEGESDHAFVHTIRTQDENKVCATAQTVWKKR